jgi:hypothetical protein
VPNSGDGTDQDFALTCYNCAQEPTFTLGVDQSSASVCAPSDANYDLNIGAILGYNESVALSTTGEPAGVSVSFSTNPVAPPGTSTLTLGNTGAATPGSYSFDVVGTTPIIIKTRQLSLDLFDAAPSSPMLTVPPDGGLNVATDVTLMWNAATQAQLYTVEVDDDPGFGSIEFSTTTSGTSQAVPQGELTTNTTYYWRVSVANTCGMSDSAVFDFTTVAAPGDCGPGSSPVFYYQDDMESGAGSWSHSAGTGNDTWVLNSSSSHSPTMAWNADDYEDISDQRLSSPGVAIPPGATTPTLQFWTAYDIEEQQFNLPNCYDAAILEFSTNGGANWTQVDNGMLDTHQYSGEVSDCCDNPLETLQAGCNTQDWTETVVDLTGFEGQTLYFRFRLGTDTSVAAGFWHVDDVVVQSCVSAGPGLPWGNGFENANP